MYKVFFSLLTLILVLFCNRAWADTGCYVTLAVQGVDDNTLYLQPDSLGSFEYAGIQYHPENPQCIEQIGGTCYINRQPSPPFINGPQYDSGVLVNYSPGVPCPIDDGLIFLSIPLAYLGYRFVRKVQKDRNIAC